MGITMSQKTYRNISIDMDTYHQLKKHGEVPDSFCDVIKGLIAYKEQHQLPAAEEEITMSNNEAVGAAQSSIVTTTTTKK